MDSSDMPTSTAVLPDRASAEQCKIPKDNAEEGAQSPNSRLTLPKSDDVADAPAPVPPTSAVAASAADANGLKEKPSSPSEESEIIRSLEKKVGSKLIEGDSWFILSKRWWGDWRQFSSYDSPSKEPMSTAATTTVASTVDVGGYPSSPTSNPTSTTTAAIATPPVASTPPVFPGTIDNSHLVDEQSSTDTSKQLLRGLQEYEDFVLMPSAIWKQLHFWYGGGPEIERQVVSVGSGFYAELRVELYPMLVNVCEVDEEGNYDRTESEKKQVPRSGLLRDVLEQCHQGYGARLWLHVGEESTDQEATLFEGFSLLSDTSKSLEELGLMDGSLLLLEKEQRAPWSYKVKWPFFRRKRLEQKKVICKDPADPSTRLEVDDRIDAGVTESDDQDPEIVKMWYPARILEAEDDRVLVQFQGREKPKPKLPPLLTESGYFGSGQLTPEIEAKLDVVFKRYATNGKIGKEGLRGILSCATNMLVQEESPQITNLLTQYGDGSILDREGFMKYWLTRFVNKINSYWLEDELTRLFERVNANTTGQTEEEKLLMQGKEWISRKSPRLGVFRSHAYRNSWQIDSVKWGFYDFREHDQVDALLEGVWKPAEVYSVDWEEMTITVKAKDERMYGQPTFVIPMESKRIAEFETKSLAQEEDAEPLLIRTQSGGGVCARPGACGLQNLGNTCFMNSTLQCLSNCSALRCFFAGTPQEPPAFHSDLSNSPLSMNGRLAREFGRLLAQIWSNERTSCAPVELKSLIGQKRPEFSGFQQQDAHELLIFMLDGLHEDVNKAPYPRPILPEVEAKGRPGAEVAAEAWSQYLQRNNSRIVDLFQFQIRSEVECPVCNTVSMTFDPIMYLTLPVPKPPHTVKLTVIPIEYPRKPIEIVHVPVDKGATFAKLESCLHQHLGKEPSVTQGFVFADIYKLRVEKFFEPAQWISEVRHKDDLWAIEARIPPGKLRKTHYFQVMFRRKSDIIAPPRVVCLGEETKHSEVLNQLLAFSSELLACAAVSRSQAAAGTENEVSTPTAAAASASASAASAPEKMGEADYLMFNETSKEGHPLPKDDRPVEWPTNGFISNLTGTGAASSSSKCFVVDLGKVDLATQLPYCLPKEVSGQSNGANTIAGLPATSLKQCLMKNAEKEQLAEEDSVYCRQCKEHRRSWKRIELWNLPSQLIIHLKRFGRDRLDGPLTKIETPVEFPLELDLSDYLANPSVDATYELYGVVNHHGSLAGGHYTAHAYVTSPSDLGSGSRHEEGQWFNFNDSFVTQASTDQLDFAAAYILFYRQKPSEAPAAKAAAAAA